MKESERPSAPTAHLLDILQRKEICLYCSSKPLGDALFITTAAREIHKRNPSVRISVQTHWPSLFLNNPDVAGISGIREPFVAPENGFQISYDDPWPPVKIRHVLEIICRRLGLEGPIDARTYYNPREDERRLAAEMRPANGHPLVVVHPKADGELDMW